MRSRIGMAVLVLAFGLLLQAQDQQPAQQPAPAPASQESSSQQQNPPDSPDAGKPDNQNPDNTQQPSKIKRKLKHLAPNCVPGKCWGDDSDTPQNTQDKTKLSSKDRADQQAQANQGQSPNQPAQSQNASQNTPAQQPSQPQTQPQNSEDAARQQTGTLNRNQAPRSPTDDQNKGYSSSKDRDPDEEPPAPNASELDPGAASDVSEMHPWDPHQSAKDVEVGDYYYKEGNYKAAISRYEEALYYKNNDAVATFRLAQAYDKTKNYDQARKFYEQYLKILPNGSYAKDAHKALERLTAQNNKPTSPPAEKPR